jgi:hypothetical protein
VAARNADYRSGASEPTAAPADERAEYERIYHEALQAKLSTGTVHVYLLDPAGHPLDSLHVAQAIDPGRVSAMLERVVTKLKVAPGSPLVEPCCQSTAPPSKPGDLVLHLTARYLERKGRDYVRIQPVLGTERSGQWASLPSEDWIVLTSVDWRKLLPAGKVNAGMAWNWDREVSVRLLNHFYPPTENTVISKNRIDEQRLRATVYSLQSGVARARVEGHLRMKHPFYHKDTEDLAEADVLGVLEFTLDRPAIRSLHLVTEQGAYGGSANARQPFGVALRSLP